MTVAVQEVTSRECSEVSRVEEAPRTHTIHTLSLDQAGNCSARVLTQTQQVSSHTTNGLLKNHPSLFFVLQVCSVKHS